MRKSSPIWIIAVVALFIFLIINLVLYIKIIEYKSKTNSISIRQELRDKSYFSEYNLSFEGKTDTDEECPDAKGGSEDAYLHIKYFYTRFCPWCKKEEPILNRLVEDYGNLVHIDWYDLNRCGELGNQYQVSGVPTLVFKTKNNESEYLHYGFIYEKDLKKLVCDVTGGCIAD